MYLISAKFVILLVFLCVSLTWAYFQKPLGVVLTVFPVLCCINFGQIACLLCSSLTSFVEGGISGGLICADT